MKRQHFLFVWRFWGNNLTWFVPIDQTRKAFNLKDKTRRERKTVCRTLINISSWFLGINYTSSWISQPLSMWDGAVLVPLKYSLLSLRFLPLMLHILLLLLPFSLCSLYSFFFRVRLKQPTQTKTRYTLANSCKTTCLSSDNVLLNVHTHTETQKTNTLRAKDTDAQWSRAWTGEQKQICQQYMALCVRVKALVTVLITETHTPNLTNPVPTHRGVL